jgi:Tfp pilus assembly protein PilX
MAPLTRSRRSCSRSHEQGFVLLLSLITLLVLLFGVLFTMRGTLLQTAITGNTLQRQKNVQASDLVLRKVQQVIINTVQGAGNLPLEVAASGKPWFYVPSASTTAWTVPGSSAAVSYWANCQGNKTCDTISDMDSSVTGYDALVTVVPTNLPVDNYGCQTSGYVASYYDIFIHTTEANGSTGASTETVFKLCTPG